MSRISQRRTRVAKGNWRRLRRGATVVEFAVVAPIFFLFIFASIEFGRMSMLRHAADQAAYEACRSAMVPGATASEATAEASRVLGVLGVSHFTVNLNPTVITDDTTSLTVTVNVPMAENSFIFPRFTNGLQLKGEATLRTERVRSVGT